MNTDYVTNMHPDEFVNTVMDVRSIIEKLSEQDATGVLCVSFCTHINNLFKKDENIAVDMLYAFMSTVASSFLDRVGLLEDLEENMTKQ